MSNQVIRLEMSGGLPTPRGQVASQDNSGRAAEPTHDEIACRAYDIYIRRGRPANQCKQNWRLAEREFRRRPMVWPEPSPMVIGSANRYSEVLNGKRPDVDARLIRAVLSAPTRVSARASEPQQGASIAQPSPQSTDRAPEVR